MENQTPEWDNFDKWLDLKLQLFERDVEDRFKKFEALLTIQNLVLMSKVNDNFTITIS